MLWRVYLSLSHDIRVEEPNYISHQTSVEVENGKEKARGTDKCVLTHGGQFQFSSALFSERNDEQERLCV